MRNAQGCLSCLPLSQAQQGALTVVGASGQSSSEDHGTQAPGPALNPWTDEEGLRGEQITHLPPSPARPLPVQDLAPSRPAPGPELAPYQPGVTPTETSHSSVTALRSEPVPSPVRGGSAIRQALRQEGGAWGTPRWLPATQLPFALSHLSPPGPVSPGWVCEQLGSPVLTDSIRHLSHVEQILAVMPFHLLPF